MLGLVGNRVTCQPVGAHQLQNSGMTEGHLWPSGMVSMHVWTYGSGNAARLAVRSEYKCILTGVQCSERKDRCAKCVGSSRHSEDRSGGDVTDVVVQSSTRLAWDYMRLPFKHAHYH